MIAQRYINPADIMLPPRFAIDVYISNLTCPIDMEFSVDGSLYIADAGAADGDGKVLRLHDGMMDVFARGFNPPLTGITLYNNALYVSHRGFVTVLRPDGSRSNVLEGLPSLGDHHNNKVEFGADGRMYFGQGTVTNSGVAGLDNSDWIKAHPSFHDYPAQPVTLKGTNFKTQNILSRNLNDVANTGVYSPFGVSTTEGEIVKGTPLASGSILSANSDGSGLKTVAWGLRNPFRLKFDRFGRIITTNHGMDVRGSRPVANATDELYYITSGNWYGWPDYSGGLPVTLPQFKPENEPQPEFVLAQHPMAPPKPLAAFTPHSAIMGFDFNYSSTFPGPGSIYIAEFGSEAPETTGGKPSPFVGHRVSNVDAETGAITTFAVNRSGVAASESGSGGFERPIGLVFGPDGNLYVSDFGLSRENDGEGYIAGTGLIWRISRVS